MFEFKSKFKCKSEGLTRDKLQVTTITTGRTELQRIPWIACGRLTVFSVSRVRGNTNGLASETRRHTATTPRWMFPPSKHRGPNEAHKLFRRYRAWSKVTGTILRPGTRPLNWQVAPGSLRWKSRERLASDRAGNRVEKDRPLFWSVQLFNRAVVLIEPNWIASKMSGRHILHGTTTIAYP